MQKVYTVTTASPVVVNIGDALLGQVGVIQIDALGANSVAVATQVTGMSDYITQAGALTNETLVLEMINVTNVKLTATGGNMEVSVGTRIR